MYHALTIMEFSLFYCFLPKFMACLINKQEQATLSSKKTNHLSDYFQIFVNFAKKTFVIIQAYINIFKNKQALVIKLNKFLIEIDIQRVGFNRFCREEMIRLLGIESKI